MMLTKLFTLKAAEDINLQKVFDGIDKSHFEIKINGVYIPPDQWDIVPKNAVMDIYLRPQGGGGGKLRTIAMLTVAVAAVFAPYAVGLQLATWQGALVSLGVVTVGGLLVNQLLPVNIPSINTDEIPGQEVASLSASKNQPAPYTQFPKLYGTRRIKPVYAANPKVDLVGNDQFIELLFFLNYGPVRFAGKNIGYDQPFSVYSFSGHELVTESDGLESVSIKNTPLRSMEFEELVVGKASEVAKKMKKDVEILQPGQRVIQDFMNNLGNKGSFEDNDTIKEIHIEPVDRGSMIDFTTYCKPDGTIKGGRGFKLYYKTEYNQTYREFPYNEENGPVMEMYGEKWWNAGTYRNSIKFRNLKSEDESKITDLKFVGGGWYDGKVQISELLTYNDFPIATTALNTKSAEIHLYSDSGIYSIEDDGDRRKTTYTFKVYYRKVGTTNWIYATDMVLSGDTKNPVRVMATIDFPTPDAYDVCIRYWLSEGTTGNDFEAITWVYLQSIQDTETDEIWGGDYIDPAIKEIPTLAYLKLKATSKLNGILEEISFYLFGLVNSPFSQSWVVADNPADAFYDALTGQQLIERIKIENIDMNGLWDWYTWCSTYDFKINAYFVENSTLWNRLKTICKPGLAYPYIQDNKFTVVRDKEDSPISQVITPRNSWGFKATKDFNKVPHAAKMNFTDPVNWETKTIIVYNKNPETGAYYDKFTATDFIEISELNIINTEQAKRFARYYLADLNLRPIKYSVNLPIENIIAEVGDKIKYSYDVVRVGETYGRIKEVLYDGEYKIGVVVDEPVAISSGKAIQIRYVSNSGLSTILKRINADISDALTLYFDTPTTEPFSAGDLFYFGMPDTIEAEGKIKNIIPDMENFTAQIDFVDAADEIHDTYLKNDIPTYEPIIATVPNLSQSRLPAPTILDIQNIAIINGNIAQAGLIITFEVPNVQIPIKQVLVEIKKDGLIVASNIREYEIGIQSIEAYPISENTEYTIELYLKSDNNSISSKAIRNFTTTVDLLNSAYIPPIPTDLEFVKAPDGKIRLLWTPVKSEYPVTYKIARNDGINLVDYYYTNYPDLQLEDYFTSDFFSVAAVVSVNGLQYIGQSTNLIQCPFSNSKLMLNSIEYTTEGVKVNLLLPEGVVFDKVLIRKGTSWSSSVDIGYTKTNSIVLKDTIAGTYNYLFCGQTIRGEIGDALLVTYTIRSPNAPSNFIYAVDNYDILFTWDDDAKTDFPISHYIVNTQKIDGTSLKIGIDWVGEKQFTLKAVDIFGNQSLPTILTINVSLSNTPSQIITTGKLYGIDIRVDVVENDTFELIELWAGTVNDRNTAKLVYSGKSHEFSLTNLSMVDSRYFWARTKNKFGFYSDWYPENQYNGVFGATSSDPTKLLDTLQGNISEDQLVSSLNKRIDIIDTGEYIVEREALENGIVASMQKATIEASFEIVKHDNNIEELRAITNEHLEQIRSLQYSLNSLITEEYNSTIEYPIGKKIVYNGDVWEALQSVIGIAPDAPENIDAQGNYVYWQPTDNLSTIVSELETRVDQVENEIATKVDQVDFNSLNNVVSAHTTSIQQNAQEILLKADKTEVSALSDLVIQEFNTSTTYSKYDFVKYNNKAYKAKQNISFTPAPTPTNTTYWEEVGQLSRGVTTALSGIEINANNISLYSSQLTSLTDTVESAISTLDTRLNQAEISLDGINSTINLHTSQITTIGNDVTSVSSDIQDLSIRVDIVDTGGYIVERNALEDGIVATLYQSTIEVPKDIINLNTKINEAEINIDGINSTISLHTSQITTHEELITTNTTSISTLTSRITAAEIDIDGINSTISLQASQINTLNNQTAAIQQTLSVASSDIGDLKAEYMLKTDVNGYVAGFGLVNEGATSEFAILANKFKVAMPDGSGTPKQVFTVGSINGNSAVGISGDLILDGSLTARAIATGTLQVGTNITVGAGAIDWNTHISGTGKPANNADVTQDKLNAGADISKAMAAGYTLISGGYINTNIITVGTANIQDAAITTAKIQDAAITSAKIISLDANKINASSLSAISANLGTVTAGDITSAVFRTSASGERITINENNDNRLKFYNSSGNNIVTLGTTYSGSRRSLLYIDSRGLDLGRAIYANSNNFITIEAGNTDGIGVYGRSNNSRGVDGLSKNGVGVRGHAGPEVWLDPPTGVIVSTDHHIGVSGRSIEGIGIYGSSYNSIGIAAATSSTTHGAFYIIPKSDNTLPTAPLKGEFVVLNNGALFYYNGSSWKQIV